VADCDDSSQISIEEAISQLEAAFAPVLGQLRTPTWQKADVRFRELSRVIAQLAARDWTLVVHNDAQSFDVSRTQDTVSFSRTAFGAVCKTIVDSIASSTDVAIVRIWRKLEERGDAASFLLQAYLATFLGHEFLHLEQHLGSDQYKDSDDYSTVVAAVDYQADIGAIQHVTAAYDEASGPLTRTEFLVLLLAAHICSMHGFTPGDHNAAFPGDVFERLLVWNFQFARAAGSDHPVHAGHLSLEVMPVINLPRMGRVSGDPVPPDFGDRLSNSAASARQDIVVSVPDARGILTIKRLVSTDGARVGNLVSAVVSGDLAIAREQLGEFFATHAVLLDLRRGSSRRAGLIQGLSAAFSAATELRAQVEAGQLLSFDHGGVADFFDRFDLLLQRRNPTLRGKWVAPARTRYGTDSLASLRQNLQPGLTPPEISARIADEVRRLQTRLSSSIDEEQNAGA
jgi:hypothetical protein